MSLEDAINRLADAIIQSRPPSVQAEQAQVTLPAAANLKAPRVKPDKPVQPKYNDVREAILDLAEKKGMPAALAVLKKFDVTHAKSLKPEQYAEALAACQAA